MATKKIDYKRELRELYAPGVEPLVDAGHVEVHDRGQVCMGLDALMVMQPDQVTTEIFEDAWAKAAKKKSLAAISKVRLQRLTEGLVAQITHIGPYAAEGTTLQRLHAFIAERGYERSGKHHEIYLSDPRRVAPERMKTILRQPVAIRHTTETSPAAMEGDQRQGS